MNKVTYARTELATLGTSPCCVQSATLAPSSSPAQLTPKGSTLEALYLREDSIPIPGGPRVLQTMRADGMLFRAGGYIDRRTRAPQVALALLGSAPPP